MPQGDAEHQWRVKQSLRNLNQKVDVDLLAGAEVHELVVIVVSHSEVNLVLQLRQVLVQYRLLLLLEYSVTFGLVERVEAVRFKQLAELESIGGRLVRDVFLLFVQLGEVIVVAGRLVVFFVVALATAALVFTALVVPWVGQIILIESGPAFILVTEQRPVTVLKMLVELFIYC